MSTETGRHTRPRQTAKTQPRRHGMTTAPQPSASGTAPGGPPATGQSMPSRPPERLWALAGRALGTEQAAGVLRPGRAELVSILSISAMTPMDPAVRGPFLGGV